MKFIFWPPAQGEGVRDTTLAMFRCSTSTSSMGDGRVQWGMVERGKYSEGEEKGQFLATHAIKCIFCITDL